ncbi:MAG: 4Fe-4S dicluster domain-containing protein [Deltaproteobacteria bacterium]|nr:4Fe-4S dicluster domain-containing protein [Deltaproteobacteria bacterium]
MQLCVDFCPQPCIEISDQLNAKGYFPARFRSNHDLCTGCGICATMCPDVSNEVYRVQE